MKRIIIYVVLILVCLALGIFGFLNRGLSILTSDIPNSDILNKTFYRYSGITGEYEELSLTENTLSYNGNDLDIKECKTYTYNKDTQIFKLNCKKEFSLVVYIDETLVIKYNNNNYYFNINKEKSFNDEFKRTFTVPVETYKIEGESRLLHKKIDITKLNELLESDTNSYIYIKSGVCDLNCTLFNKAFLKMGDPNKLYVLNIDEITPNEYQDLIDNYEGFLLSQDEYLTDKPSVIVVGNRRVSSQIEIEIEGFNINKYDNFFNANEGNHE